MEIPFTTILTKIAEEVNKSQSSQNVQQMREHVAAIRVLCDILLENASRQHKDVNAISLSEPVKQMLHPSPARSERIDIGDDANGPSLFDF